jgi:hypothetical protein
MFWGVKYGWYVGLTKLYFTDGEQRPEVPTFLSLTTAPRKITERKLKRQT